MSVAVVDAFIRAATKQVSRQILDAFVRLRLNITAQGGTAMQGLAATEFEDEFEDELELDGEYEEALGGVAPGLGEFEDEFEGEPEGEFELDGEEFFRRRIGGWLRRAAPLLRRVARVAAPIVGTAVGGPLGGMLARGAASLLEGEYEDEFEGDGEWESWEADGEFETDMEDEAPPATQSDALAELMAAVASQAQTEEEAEAMAGAATLLSISPADRAALRAVLPNLVRGTAALTRILRRRRATRPAVRAIPTIVRRTSRTLASRAAAGRPVTRRDAARVMAGQTRRVLGSPRTCGHAMRRNVRAATVATRRGPGPVRRPVRY